MLSLPDMPIIDYLDIIFMLICFGLMRLNIIIQALSIYTNFLSFLRNAKGEIDFFFLIGVQNSWSKIYYA